MLPFDRTSGLAWHGTGRRWRCAIRCWPLSWIGSAWCRSAASISVEESDSPVTGRKGEHDVSRQVPACAGSRGRTCACQPEALRCIPRHFRQLSHRTLRSVSFQPSFRSRHLLSRCRHKRGAFGRALALTASLAASLA